MNTTQTTPDMPPVFCQTIFNRHAALAGGQSPVEETKHFAATQIRARGYRVMPGQRGRSYLWFTDTDRVACLEARWAINQAAGRAGRATHRFQIGVRGHRFAHLLLLLALTPDQQHFPFLIPMAQIGQRRNIAIWSENPAEYKGQWAPYLNDWDQQLAAALATAPTAREWGLVLFQ